MALRREVLTGLAAAAGLGAAGWARPQPAQELTGVWTNAWYTKLQRPKALKALVLTPAEAEAYEAPRRAHAGELIDREHDVVGQAETEFPDNGPGLARIDGQIRSSWIVEPADGRLPWKQGVKAKLGIDQEDQPLDNPEQRDEDERCVSIEGGSAPILNSHDANVLEIVQTKDWMVVVGEKHHEARIVRIVEPGRAAPDPRAAGLREWQGASVGHWEGRTLVVETSGLRGLSKLNDDLWLSGDAKIVERFTRTGPSQIRYDFAVDDPTLFTQPWRAESVFRTAEGRLFEYACHEGNYGLPDILRAARRAEAAKASGAGK